MLKYKLISRGGGHVHALIEATDARSAQHVASQHRCSDTHFRLNEICGDEFTQLNLTRRPDGRKRPAWSD